MVSASDRYKQLKDIINSDQWDECFADTNFPRTCIPSSTNSESSGPVTRRKRPSPDNEEFRRKLRFFRAKSTSGMLIFSILNYLFMFCKIKVSF